MSETGDCRLLVAETEALVGWHADVAAAHDDDFEAAKELVSRLGAGYDPESGHTEVGFWAPEVVEADGEAVHLEVLTATEDVDLTGGVESVTFRRERVPLERRGEFFWGVVEGMRPGTPDELGSLYQLAYRADGEWHDVQDPLAYSVPFGSFGPAELYDMERLDEEREDRPYFEALGTDEEPVETWEHDGLPRISAGTSMLELHPGTATEDGTLGGLARMYDDLGAAIRDDDRELTPAQRNFAGYDAIQVMPVEPLTENEALHDFWSPAGGTTADAGRTADEPATGGAGTADRDDGDDEAAGDDGAAGGDRAEAVPATDVAEVEIEAGRPELINWGYDIVVRAFSAPNPAILETGRPDELVAFIAACHNLPRPIRVVFDVALGHADNRGTEVLDDRYILGPGMYGKHLDYTEPTARAVFLELQKRKMDFGADGIRVDGAQDFTSYDPETGEMYHDDAFLAEMDRVTQEVCGTEYRPWMIYEDGRPWPREDWELASSYRALIEQHPHSFQWSPISFAHNTPALLTFWATKWWRVKEVAEFGSHWTTGVANHDTIRRGTQIDPTVEFNQSPVNPYLGDDYPETINNAYNNPAVNMAMHCFLPGVPMDFTHANFRAPWGFIRDTDEEWNVKVVADESMFLYWQVREEDFENPAHFQRIKDLGFETKEGLRAFMTALSDLVDATDYDLEVMAEMLSVMDQPLGDDLSPADLEAYAYAWMRDVHDFANLAHWADEQDTERTAFDLAVREFRQDREWLRRDVRFTEDEAYGYRHPTEGTVLYYGLRRSPAAAGVDADESDRSGEAGAVTDHDGTEEELLFAGNMEGVPVEVSPASLSEQMDETEVAESGWEVALAAPGVDAAAGDPASEVELDNAQAIVWRREP